MKLSLSDPEKAPARISTCCRSGAQCLQAGTQNLQFLDKIRKSAEFSATREREERTDKPVPPPGCHRHHNTQEIPGEGGSRTAPSSRRRPQIEAVINHASAEWNRTTAIAPYRVLCWSSTTVLLSMSPCIYVYRSLALAPEWRFKINYASAERDKATQLPC